MNEGTHVVVTGGAGGMGAATIEMLLGRGHRVTCFDLVKHPDERVHSEIVDITDEENVRTAILNAEREQGMVRALAVCHGIRGAYRPATDITVEEMRRQFDIHVVGSLLVSREMVCRLNGESGSIVMISSTTAYGGWVNQADYGSAKAAERQLAENLAIEWAPLGIRVNSIAPGHTMTPMVTNLVSEEGYDLSAVEARMPLGRLAEPREMAEAIVWLLFEATFVTGQCLPVDGGWTAVGK